MLDEIERKVGGTVVDITAEDSRVFHMAMQDAQRGDRILYHVGPHCGGVHRYLAQSASERGKCILFCKRVGDGVFAYLAVKR
jgi:hypothetical protein